MNRFFYGINEPLKHLGDFLCFICKFTHLFMAYLFEPCSKVKLRPKFCHRAFGYIQKLYKFLFCLALRALRYIRWNGYSRPGYLIVKSKILGAVKDLINQNSQLTASFPYFQLFKILVHNIKYTALLSTFNSLLSTFNSLLSTFNFQLSTLIC